MSILEVIDTFASLDKDLAKVVTISCEYEKIGKKLKRKLRKLLSKHCYLNAPGLEWTNYLYQQGFSLPCIYLSYRLASSGLTTHYFSLLAESVPISTIDYNHGLKTYSSFFKLRLSLVILHELERVNLVEVIEEKLNLRSAEDVKNIPPLLVLLIKNVL
jgi:hypothetical protein